MDALTIDEVNAAIRRDLVCLAIFSDDEKVVLNGISHRLGLFVPIHVRCLWSEVHFPNDLMVHPIDECAFPSSVNKNVWFLSIRKSGIIEMVNGLSSVVCQHGVDVLQCQRTDFRTGTFCSHLLTMTHVQFDACITPPCKVFGFRHGCLVVGGTTRDEVIDCEKSFLCHKWKSEKGEKHPKCCFFHWSVSLVRSISLRGMSTKSRSYIRG